MLRDFTWTEKYEEAMSDEHSHIFKENKEHLGKQETQIRRVKVAGSYFHRKEHETIINADISGCP